MSALILTIGDDFVLLSQDTLQCEAEARTTDQSLARRLSPDEEAQFYLEGRGSIPSKPIGESSKFCVVPHLNLIAGSQGFAQVAAGFYAWLLCDAGPTWDVSDMDRAVPPILRQILQMCGGVPASFTIAGLSAKGPMGFGFYSGEDFEPVPLSPGTSFSPALRPEAKEDRVLIDAVAQARRGVDPEGAHAKIARGMDENEPLRFGVGGQLLSARVDGSGVSVRETYRFVNALAPGRRG